LEIDRKVFKSIEVSEVVEETMKGLAGEIPAIDRQFECFEVVWTGEEGGKSLDI